MILRSALAALLISTSGLAALAGPTLRGDIRIDRDIVTLGDLVEGLDGPAAHTPLFGAPRLGETGTIQAQRVLGAARSLGIDEIETGGVAQVTVSRPGRRIGATEVEKALRVSIAMRQAREAEHLSIVFDGGPPALILPLAIDGDLVVEDLVHDPRARRVTAHLAVAAKDGTMRRTLKVAGTIVETAPVAVVVRPVNRGDRIEPGDVVVEKRARESVPPDSVADLAGAVGFVAKRAFSPGSLVRGADVAKPEIVQRGEIVTLVYQTPGMILTTRGKVADAGGLGDTVTVQNLQSKRMLQGTITGPGRVAVTHALPGRVAATASQ